MSVCAPVVLSASTISRSQLPKNAARNLSKNIFNKNVVDIGRDPCAGLKTEFKKLSVWLICDLSMRCSTEQKVISTESHVNVYARQQNTSHMSSLR